MTLQECEEVDCLFVRAFSRGLGRGRLCFDERFAGMQGSRLPFL